MKRFAALTFGAVLLATAILAVLGYLSLRHWEASAALLFRQQARDMAVMAAEKIEMTILKSEEECLSGLQRLVLEPDFSRERVGAWKARTPLVDRVYLTEVDAEIPDADTFFPPWGKGINFREIERTAHPADERHPYSFRLLTLERIRP